MANNALTKVWNENSTLVKKSDTAKMALAKRSIENATSIYEAYQEQVQAGILANNVQSAMDEIQVRTDMQVANIFEQADKVVAAQKSSYVKAGVEFSGSAMSVISDTVNDAAEAVFIKQMEANYELQGLAFKKGALERQASNANLLTEIAKGTLKSAAGLAGDFADIKKGNSKNTGAMGLGKQ